MMKINNKINNKRDNKTISNDVAEILLRIKSITFSKDAPYKFGSGLLSPIYCDNRLLMSYPNERVKIRDFFIRIIEEKKIDFSVIAGTATAAIPHAAWLADKLEKPMIYVRAKPKEYGKENQIEGKLKKGEKVLVIEDLFSTGKSSASVVKAIQDKGCFVEFCLAIFSYGFRELDDNFEKLDCKPLALSDFSTLIDVALKNNYINEQYKNKILQWNNNPQRWSEKFGNSL